MSTVIDRNLKLWVGACVALGLAMAACGMRPGTLPADADPEAWRLMAAAGAALARADADGTERAR